MNRTFPSHATMIMKTIVWSDWQQRDKWCHASKLTTYRYNLKVNVEKKSAYILWLHSNVLAELLHALWTNHIITTYTRQTSVRPHIASIAFVRQNSFLD